MTFSRTHSWRVPVLAVLMLSSGGTVGADEPTTDLWARLRGLVSQEQDQLQDMLKKQSEMQSQETELLEQLEQGRNLRAMHREAVLLSELNMAWINDELDHWDCRVAEQKQLEVESRIAELADFGLHLDTLCNGLGTDETRQGKICASRRDDLARSVAELEGLGQRYAAACTTKRPSINEREGEKPWQ